MSVLRQAGCVAINGRGVLIEGEPDAGKTSLALALIDRDALLVGDDGVQLERRGDALWASPPPHTGGMIEIRNVGIAELPALEAPVCLRIVLAPEAPRFVDAAEQTEILGCSIPSLALYPDSPVLALRAEYALGLHGLALPNRSDSDQKAADGR